MGMMVVDDNEFESQLSKCGRTTSKDNNQSKVVDMNIGRGNKKEVPMPIKKIISEEAIKGAPASELAKIFDVSPASISAYKKGATSTSTYHEPNQELKKSNDSVKERISASARERLEQSLNEITAEKLKDANLKTVASVAKDMSVIIKNMEPEKEPGDIHNNTQFIYYAPPMKSENDYDIIQVNE